MPLSQNVMQLASAAAENPGIIEGLGIDWTLLVLQLVAFLLLVWALSKFVYPVFLRVLDEREERIESSLKAAREAEDHASQAQDKIDHQLDKARKEARDIVATAKSEANALLAAADTKSRANADHMVAAARDEIHKETLAAKKALHNETIELVAQATAKVVEKTHTAKADAAVIKSALDEAHKEATR